MHPSLEDVLASDYQMCDLPRSFYSNTLSANHITLRMINFRYSSISVVKVIFYSQDYYF